jgi:hypothetical protein
MAAKVKLRDDRLSDRQRNSLGSEAEQCDRRIDQLVYKLYGLTDKEIALVEEATNR